MYKLSKKELALLKSGKWKDNPELKEIMPEKNLYLFQANLYGADLHGACLCRANLYRADLYRASLAWADLYRAYLAEADLTEADLYKAILVDANLEGTNLRETNFTDAIIDKNNFDKYIDKSIWECEVLKNDIVRIKRKG